MTLRVRDPRQSSLDFAAVAVADDYRGAGSLVTDEKRPLDEDVEAHLQEVGAYDDAPRYLDPASAQEAPEVTAK